MTGWLQLLGVTSMTCTELMAKGHTLVAVAVDLMIYNSGYVSYHCLTFKTSLFVLICIRWGLFGIRKKLVFNACQFIALRNQRVNSSFDQKELDKQ